MVQLFKKITYINLYAKDRFKSRVYIQDSGALFYVRRKLINAKNLKQRYRINKINLGTYQDVLRTP